MSIKVKFSLVLFFSSLCLFSFGQTPTPVVPPTVGIQGGIAIGETGLVGNISGSYSISGSGAMVYSIPLMIPDGAGGMKPDLSIVYNSQAGNGLLGVGWDIAGLSSITRDGFNLYNGTYNQGINFNSGDRFQLDGNRLILTSGSAYGGNGSIYATEYETFSKITSYGGTTANGPDYFIVMAKNGLIYEYGNSTDSREMTNSGTVVNKWLLNKISNRTGYSITYEYFHSSSSQVNLSKITYSLNSLIANFNYQYTIEFNYVSRIDKSKYFLSGNKQLYLDKLDNIKIKSHATTDKEMYVYSFSYGNSSNGPKYSNLNSISLAASSSYKNSSGNWDVVMNGTNIEYSHFNPLEIIWNSEGYCSFNNTQTTPATSGTSGSFTKDKYYTNNTTHPRFIGDFNGDGKDDILGIGQFQNKFEVALSTGAGFSSPTEWCSNAAISSACSLNNTPISMIPWCSEAYSIIKLGDVNGDGLTDVVGFSRSIPINVYAEK